MKSFFLKQKIKALHYLYRYQLDSDCTTTEMIISRL